MRAALTDDGRPPLAASGLKLLDRLEQIVASLDRVAARGSPLPGGLKRLRQLTEQRLGADGGAVAGGAWGLPWVKRVARLLANEPQRSARQIRRQLSKILSQMRRAAATTPVPELASQLRHFVKVSKSYWSGLFGC